MSGTITINSNDLLNAIKPQLLQMPEITQQPYNYIVYTDGTYYYAKNGSTGKIDYVDTDAATVLNAVIQQAKPGDYIFVRDSLVLNSPIIIPNGHNVKLIGNRYKPWIVNFADYGIIIDKVDVGILQAYLKLNVDNAKGVLVRNSSWWQLYLDVDGLGYGHGHIGVMFDRTIPDAQGGMCYWNHLFVGRIGGTDIGVDKGIVVGNSSNYPANSQLIVAQYIYAAINAVEIQNGYGVQLIALDIGTYGSSIAEAAVALRSRNTGFHGFIAWTENPSGIPAFKAEANTTFNVNIGNIGPGILSSIDPAAQGILIWNEAIYAYGNVKTPTPSSVLLYYNPSGASFTPGTSYITPTPLQSARTRIDFGYLRPRFIRVVVYGGGNEAGAGKGVAIVNPATGETVCNVEWSGTSLGLNEGNWTPISYTSAQSLLVAVKASSSTETLTIYRIEVQFR